MNESKEEKVIIMITMMWSGMMFFFLLKIIIIIIIFIKLGINRKGQLRYCLSVWFVPFDFASWLQQHQSCRTPNVTFFCLFSIYDERALWLGKKTIPNLQNNIIYFEWRTRSRATVIFGQVMCLLLVYSRETIAHTHTNCTLCSCLLMNSSNDDDDDDDKHKMVRPFPIRIS